MNGDWQLSDDLSFACKQTSHFHLLYTPSCKVAHPFHKGDKSFLWKCQPKSPSVYAGLKDLDFMQIFCFDLNSLFKRECNICAVCSLCPGSPFGCVWLSLSQSCSPPTCFQLVQESSKLWSTAFLAEAAARGAGRMVSCLLGLQAPGCDPLGVFTSDLRALL